MKANFALIGSSLAFVFFALALLCAAPVKADPIGAFLDGFLGARQLSNPAPLSIERARRHRITASFHGGRTMIASYYGGGPRRYEPNSRTANGERFFPDGFTAAHRTLPFGARLSVCFRGCATVRVNDRGPAAWTGRALDLSRGAARAIGLIHAGVARVSVALVGD